ncbi:MAG: hypothetical protein AAGF93_10535 [Cyanobacteria bacterium P01_H01_bin.105]
MGTLIKTASPSPTMQHTAKTDRREQTLSRSNFRPFIDSLLIESSLHSDTAEPQTQLNHATNFGHQFEQVLPSLAVPQPVQAKALNQEKRQSGTEAHEFGAKAAQNNKGRISLTGEGLVSPSMDVPPVQCGLFKKIGKGFKSIGKGIGKGVKGLGKKFVDIAPSLYTFGLDVTSVLPGPIGQIGNAVRSVAGLDNSLLSGLIKGEGIESSMEDTVGSFLGGFNMPGGGGLGDMIGGGMPDLGGMFGGGMPPLAGSMPQLGGLEPLLGSSGGMDLLEDLLG